MNFNVRLDDAMARALQRIAMRRKVSCAALIRRAVQDLIHKEGHSTAWSEKVLAWQGDSALGPFESHRARLRPPAEDPLA